MRCHRCYSRSLSHTPLVINIGDNTASLSLNTTNYIVLWYELMLQYMFNIFHIGKVLKIYELIEWSIMFLKTLELHSPQKRLERRFFWKKMKSYIFGKLVTSILQTKFKFSLQYDLCVHNYLENQKTRSGGSAARFCAIHIKRSKGSPSTLNIKCYVTIELGFFCISFETNVLWHEFLQIYCTVAVVILRATFSDFRYITKENYNCLWLIASLTLRR